MSNLDKREVNQGLITHLFILIAVVVSGLYMIQNTQEDKIFELMNHIIEEGHIKPALISQLNVQFRSLPYQIKLFAFMIVFRAISYLSVTWYIPLAGICTGYIESGIKKNNLINDHSPSVTAYHTAKRMAPFAVFYLSVIYIVIPFELITGFDVVIYKYLYALINAVFCNYVFFTMSMHKPANI